MRGLLGGLLLLAGCAATPVPPVPLAAPCAPLPGLADNPTRSQLAAYAQRVVELYGECAERPPVKCAP